MKTPDCEHYWKLLSSAPASDAVCTKCAAEKHFPGSSPEWSLSTPVDLDRNRIRARHMRGLRNFNEEDYE